MLKGIIYKTTNLVNGKIYIGQKFVDTKRYLGSGTRLRDAIKHYGKENFQKIILEECDRELLNEREQYWIAFYNSMNPKIGYNLTSGGCQQKEVSESTKKLLSESHKGNIPSNKGIPKTLEERVYISKQRKGKGTGKRTPEHCKSISEGKKNGKKRISLSEEHKNNISKGLLGKRSGCTVSEITKDKIRNTLKGRKYNKRSITTCNND